jgi:RimJ/RimL family protein N-acetyltransferase
LSGSTTRGAEKALYIVTRRADGEPLGTAGFLNPYAADHAAMFHGIEIYYQIHHAYRRQGIATQSARLLVNHLFNARSIERIVGYVAEQNEPSRKRRATLRGTSPPHELHPRPVGKRHPARHDPQRLGE